MNENVDHLFVRCNFFSTIWSLVSNWLGFVTVLHGDNTEHLKHFCYLCGFSMQTCLRLKIIWLSCVWVIKKEINTIFSKRRRICICYVKKLSLYLIRGWKGDTQLSFFITITGGLTLFSVCNRSPSCLFSFFTRFFDFVYLLCNCIFESFQKLLVLKRLARFD